MEPLTAERFRRAYLHLSHSTASRNLAYMFRPLSAFVAHQEIMDASRDDLGPSVRLKLSRPLSEGMKKLASVSEAVLEAIAAADRATVDSRTIRDATKVAVEEIVGFPPAN